MTVDEPECSVPRSVPAAAPQLPEVAGAAEGQKGQRPLPCQRSRVDLWSGPLSAMTLSDLERAGRQWEGHSV